MTIYNGEFNPALSNYSSIGRVVASSKTALNDEFQTLNDYKKRFHIDVMDPIMELAEKFYTSPRRSSYTRGFEAMYHFFIHNYDVAFILYWIQIELFLKRNLRPYGGRRSEDVTKILTSLGVDKNGHRVERKRERICGKYIRIKLVMNIQKCYSERRKQIHEGKPCNEENARLCKEIAEELQLWRLIDLDNIDYELFVERVDAIRHREP